ncbi:hypothetical protein K435DRAFT_871594 [Dendrothele bispora CBS 962.96]|uniref:Uncharacterized protein n=1 Tax=Dendrothele bispora (strain CBS 962.96) TaxID=1314807 RepID=A0A4S8L3Q1_DENBC|nr:hypothetical protein K435DRAFT_871594 [Dendrothele bispora CBS 962.96]
MVSSSKASLKRKSSDIMDSSAQDSDTGSNPPIAPPLHKKVKTLTPLERDAQFLDQPKYTGKTDEEILQIQMTKWTGGGTGGVYDHYEVPYIEKAPEGHIVYKYKCKFTNYIATRARYDTSTSNLSNHKQKCARTRDAAQTQITTFAQGGYYDKGEFRYEAALWISNSNRPFLAIEDKNLNNMFRILNPLTSHFYGSRLEIRY